LIRYVKPRQARLVPLLAAALIAVHLPIYVRDFRYASVFRLSLLQAKACLLYSNIIQGECSAFLFPTQAAVLRPYANILDGLGFVRPRLVRERRLPDVQNPESSDYWGFLQAVEVNTNNYLASGSAMLPHRGEPPDAVLLAYEGEDHAEYPFAIAAPETQRDAVSALMRRGKYGDPHWSESFSISELPVNPIKLSAWAFDAYTGEVYRIPGTHVITKSKSD